MSRWGGVVVGCSGYTGLSVRTHGGGVLCSRCGHAWALHHSGGGTVHARGARGAGMRRGNAHEAHEHVAVTAGHAWRFEDEHVGHPKPFAPLRELHNVVSGERLLALRGLVRGRGRKGRCYFPVPTPLLFGPPALFFVVDASRQLAQEHAVAYRGEELVHGDVAGKERREPRGQLHDVHLALDALALLAQGLLLRLPPLQRLDPQVARADLVLGHHRRLDHAPSVPSRRTGGHPRGRARLRRHGPDAVGRWRRCRCGLRLRYAAAGWRPPHSAAQQYTRMNIRRETTTHQHTCTNIRRQTTSHQHITNIRRQTTGYQHTRCWAMQALCTPCAAQVGGGGAQAGVGSVGGVWGALHRVVWVVVPVRGV